MGKLVSIIIPCYNQAKFLEDALNSVLAQKHQEWECIIVNDGSTDDTEQIANNWVKQDSRFIYVEKQNGGLSSARNAGLDIAKGNYIQFLDADDYIDENKLKLSLHQSKKSERAMCKCVITNYKTLSQKTGKLETRKLNPLLFNLNSVLYGWDDVINIPIHCGFFDSIFFKEFRFQENIKAKEDWVMWVSFFKKDFEINYIDQPLATYRKHDDSMTMTKNILPDYILAIQFMKTFLTENEFNELSIHLFSKFYMKSIRVKSELAVIKNSNTYKIARFFKSIFSKLKILKLSKYFFELFLKFKNKR